MKNINKVKISKSAVMKMAWVFFKKSEKQISFSECLKKSWAINRNGYLPTINEIYNKNYKSVYNYVLNRVNLKHEVCEEIVADVFIKANNHLPFYDGSIAKINTWLYNIAKNSVIDYYRKNAKNPLINVGDWQDSEGNEYFQFVGDNDSSKLVENNELKTQINKAFSNLKPKYKEIAEMYFIEQMKYEEISESLNVPMGTVKGMLNRVKEMLKNELIHLAPK
jgi:RNA polymerase sigma-70 factor (ECF subfamily)